LSIKIIDVFPSEDFAEGYVAGFFDGEGSVGLYLEKNRPKPVISITNCHWHVLNYLHALVLPLLQIDVRGQKNMQIRITSWEAVKNFVGVLKDICIVKRQELELMDQAVQLHQRLVDNRSGRKIYSHSDIEDFKRISAKMRAEKKRIVEHGKHMARTP